MSQQQIKVSAGAVEYTWPVTITESTGKNISADPVLVCLALANTAPATWVAPSVDTPQTDPSKRVVQLLVDSTVPTGSYFLWVKVTDSPEVVPRRAMNVNVT